MTPFLFLYLIHLLKNAENVNMDLKSIYDHIHKAALSCIPSNSYPLAYINICVGKNFPFSDEEIQETFKKMKWDSDISTADLNIIRSSSHSDSVVEVTSVNEFIDDSGEGKTYFPDETISKLEIS